MNLLISSASAADAWTPSPSPSRWTRPAASSTSFSSSSSSSASPSPQLLSLSSLSSPSSPSSSPNSSTPSSRPWSWAWWPPSFSTASASSLPPPPPLETSSSSSSPPSLLSALQSPWPWPSQSPILSLSPLSSSLASPSHPHSSFGASIVTPSSSSSGGSSHSPQSPSSQPHQPSQPSHPPAHTNTSNYVQNNHHHHHGAPSSGSNGGEPPLSRIILCGGLGGAIADTIMHSTDTIKTKMQGQLSSGVTKYPSMYQSFRLILVEEGLRGLYSGVLAATSGSLFSTLLYFGCYEGLKRKLIDSNWNPTAAYFVSAAVGDVMASVIYVPSEVVKTRLQLSNMLTHRNYQGSVHAFWSILEKRGVRGLYYGWGATLLRDVPFTAVQFTLFENARSVFLHRFCGGDESRMKTWHDMASGAFAGVVAGAVTTPLDVCKTYIMTQKQVTPPKKKVTVQRPVNATWIDTPEIAAAASAKNAPPQPPLLNNAVPPSHSSFSPNVYSSTHSAATAAPAANAAAATAKNTSTTAAPSSSFLFQPTPRPSRTPSPTASKAGKAPAGKGVAGSAVGSSAATTKPPSPSRPRSAAAAVAAASTSSRSASTATAAGAPSAAKAAAEAAAAAAAAATKTAAAAGGTAAAAEMAVPYYSGAIQAFKGIYRRQGMAGLFAGVGPRMVWTGCQSTIMFAVYEWLLGAMSDR